MAIYANLKDYSFESAVDDIRGSDVYGTNNEKLGKVKDVIFDRDSGDLQYVVIDAAGWLTTGMFLVPAREIMDNVEGDSHFRVNLTREQIERLPAYREDELRDETKWRDYERRYQAARELKADPVLHREGSTHTITPDPDEMPASSSGSSGVQTSSPRPIAMDEPRFGATSDSEDAAHTAHLGVGPQTGHRRAEKRTETEPLPPDDRRVLGMDPIRKQFAADGTLRSEYDNQNQMRVAGDPSDPDASRRCREFQERLRRERERILRRLRERDVA
jgi:sporulation protein YlmC with PRC-barrel domain